MASAHCDSKGWRAKLSVSLQGGRFVRWIRIPAAYMQDHGHSPEAARAYAERAQRYLDTLGDRYAHPLEMQAALERAVEMRALRPEEAAAFRETAGLTLQMPLGIMEAAKMHPATQREEDSAGEYRRHEVCLQRFMDWSGAEHVQDIKRAQVFEWVDHLRRTGHEYDTRRHHLLWLRRAIIVGAWEGVIPDLLAGVRVDRKGRRGRIEVFSLPEMARAAVDLERSKRHRSLAALCLGGFMGLRPSEIYRARECDIEGDVLHTGEKNDASMRTLPIPEIVQEWLSNGAHGDGGPIIRSEKQGRAFSSSSLSRNVMPPIAAAVGRELQCRALRKSFDSWATRAGLPELHVSAYLGHRHRGKTAVETAHYLQVADARELRSTARDIDRLIRIGMSGDTDG